MISLAFRLLAFPPELKAKASMLSLLKKEPLHEDKLMILSKYKGCFRGLKGKWH